MHDLAAVAAVWEEFSHEKTFGFETEAAPNGLPDSGIRRFDANEGNRTEIMKNLFGTFELLACSRIKCEEITVNKRISHFEVIEFTWKSLCYIFSTGNGIVILSKLSVLHSSISSSRITLSIHPRIYPGTTQEIRNFLFEIIRNFYKYPSQDFFK